LKQQWCIGQLTPLFLWQMEKILDLYAQPYDPKRPLWCFDERPCQLLGDTLVPIAMKPGKKWRYDHHYERHGVCHLLVAFQPHTGQRVVEVCQRRTAKQYAAFMRTLKAVHNPDAEQVVLVQDNLNIHSPSSFYTRLPPAEALALSKQFDMHYTPVNASWLNMVEIELSVIARQCLARRIASSEHLHQEVLLLVEERNRQAATVCWPFTPELARVKFERFYPKLAAYPSG
jgi:DDE superfamily endonuclease